MNAASSPSTPTPRRRSSPISDCTPCSIADRNRRASSPPTASACASTRPWAWSPISSATKCWLLLRGVLAIGHTRYSTAGDSALLNAQPIMVQSNKGTIAIAHNGNLVNAQAIRAQAGGPGLDLPNQQRHGSAGAPDCALPRADPARCHRRRPAPRGRRVFAGHAQPRPYLRRPRSARISPAGHGPHPGFDQREKRHDRFCLRDLRF